VLDDVHEVCATHRHVLDRDGDKGPALHRLLRGRLIEGARLQDFDDAPTRLRLPVLSRGQRLYHQLWQLRHVELHWFPNLAAVRVVHLALRESGELAQPAGSRVARGAKVQRNSTGPAGLIAGLWTTWQTEASAGGRQVGG